MLIMSLPYHRRTWVTVAPKSNVLASRCAQTSRVRTNGHVGSELRQDLGAGKPRKTVCFELGRIEPEVIRQDGELVVSARRSAGDVLEVQRLGEEREAATTPSVVVERYTGRDDADHGSKVEGHLG